MNASEVFNPSVGLRLIAGATYTFNPGLKTVEIAAFEGIALNQLMVVFNQTRNQLLYYAASADHGGTIAGNTLTYTVDNVVGAQSTDELRLYIASPAAIIADALLEALANKLPLESGRLMVTEPDSLEKAAVSVSSAATLFTQDMALYRSAIVQITSAGSGNTIAFEVSNDNATWVAVTSYQPLNTGSAIPATTTQALGIYRIGVSERWFRVRVSTYGSGTVTAQAIYRSEPQRSLGIYVAGAVTQAVRLQTSTSSDGFTASQSYLAPATPAVTSLTGSANAWQGIDISNQGTSWRYVKIWNTASGSITLGTTAALLNIGIAPGTSRFLPFPIYLRFTTALCFAVTGGISLTDNTAITANEVTVTFVR